MKRPSARNCVLRIDWLLFTMPIGIWHRRTHRKACHNERPGQRGGNCGTLQLAPGGTGIGSGASKGGGEGAPCPQ